MKLYGVYATKSLGITYYHDIDKALPAAEKMADQYGAAYLVLYGSERQFLSPEEFAKAMNGQKWWTHYELLTKFVKPGYGTKKVEAIAQTTTGSDKRAGTIMAASSQARKTSKA